MDLFFEIHKDLPREGPGDNEYTKLALNLLNDLPKEPSVLDIGCGPGMQTVEIAKNIDGKIIAIDTHKPFLDQLRESANERNVSNRIEATEMSMFEMSFEDESFDIVWCEGAIFIIGFEKGLYEWKKYIKTNGYLVVTEVSWLRQDIPDDLKKFWESEYPDIRTIGQNIIRIEKEGYLPVGHLIIPETGWWEPYYKPLEERIKLMREKYKDDKEANEMMDDTINEIEMYRKYSEYYGNVFYIMKKI
jgi:ubiquinone/menaquinone biosynthesis C-methylase UbiE